ncbi:MAG: FkbM family methyltransferase, partial [Thermohalobaculum sp.]|nr:FkbM family methyltransferase [Thermohalobaculum sp.]
SARMGADTKDRLWQFAQRHATFFDVATEATIVNGMKMCVSSNPRVEQEILLFGEWEPLFTRYVQSIPANDGIFVDVGSNIGFFSLIASAAFREVHAIEASPSTSRRLQDIITANGIRNIHVHATAVGAAEGHIDFYQDKEQSGGASTIKTDDNVFEARVPVAPLEKILDGIDWGRVRFVKIDVEGLEAPALDSLFNLRESLHPKVEIFVEYDPKRLDTWPSVKAFLANGFSAVLMQGPYDRRDYVEQDRRTELKPVDVPPEMFCDLLLRRAPA